MSAPPITSISFTAHDAKLPEAPMLYRWQNVLPPRTTEAPRMPERSGRAPQAQDSTPSPPPRRPRRGQSPPRNPHNIDIPSIKLEPVFLGKDGSSKASDSGMDDLDVSQTGSLQKTVGELVSTKSLGGTSTNDVTLMFCVRRSGCGNCREHAVELSGLVNKMNTNTGATAASGNVNLMGVIKPEPVRKELLQEFAEYFPFDLYQDNDWKLFKALGGRKLSVWKLLTKAPGMESRYAQKKITNRPFGGDLFTHGGILIFDRKGRVRFVYYEKYTDVLDMEALEWAINEARQPLPGDIDDDSSINQQPEFTPSPNTSSPVLKRNKDLRGELGAKKTKSIQSALSFSQNTNLTLDDSDDDEEEEKTDNPNVKVAVGSEEKADDANHDDVADNLINQVISFSPEELPAPSLIRHTSSPWGAAPPGPAKRRRESPGRRGSPGVDTKMTPPKRQTTLPEQRGADFILTVPKRSTDEISEADSSGNDTPPRMVASSEKKNTISSRIRLGQRLSLLSMSPKLPRRTKASACA